MTDKKIDKNMQTVEFYINNKFLNLVLIKSGIKLLIPLEQVLEKKVI